MEDGKAGEVRGMIVRGIILQDLLPIPLTIIPLTNWVFEDLPAQRDKVFQQAQADRLAFFGVKLRGINIVAPDGGGERLAVSGLRGGQRGVVGLGEKAVDKIDVAAGGNSLKDRAFGPDNV